MGFGKFSLRLAAFSGVIAVLLTLITQYTDWVPSTLWFAYLFFVLLTLVIYYVSVVALKMNVRNSMNLIFGSMFFRLFSSLFFLIAYMVITDSKDIPFVVGFMVLYLLFQVFEIYHLLSNLRPDLKK